MPDNFMQLPDTTVDQIMIANARWPDFKNQHADAINTTIGVLIDPATSKPWQPKTVVNARIKALKNMNAAHTYGYQTQAGNAEFLFEAGRMVFGALYEQSSADLLAYQTLGGTGALSLTRDTLQPFAKVDRTGSISILLDPGWPNHPAIFNDPFKIITYNHVDPRNGQYNHQAALNMIQAAPGHPILLLQACGYNDDGADRTTQQWDEICEAAQKKSAVVVLDAAYLGLAGGLSLDRYPIEQCLQRGILTFICVSFSKNMGLYNERLGALFIANVQHHVNKQQTHNLNQLVMRNVRRTISSPPFSVARAAAETLRQSAYYEELETARLRIDANRQALAVHLKHQIPNIGSGRGLFTKLLAGGFTAKQTALLENEGILVLANSRLNLGGMSLDQVEKLGRVMSLALKK